MEHSSMRVEIRKLNGAANWRSWKMDIEDALVIKGVQEFIETEVEKPTAPTSTEAKVLEKYQTDLRKHQQNFSLARSILRTSLGDEAEMKVAACETPFTIWRKLHDVFEQNSTSRLRRLLTQLLRAKLTDSPDMATHLAKMRTNWVDLQTAAKQEEKISIPECILIECVFESLPQESYREFNSLWDTMSKESRTIDKLEQMLLERATRDSNSFLDSNLEEPAGFLAKSNAAKFGNGGKNAPQNGGNQSGGNRNGGVQNGGRNAGNSKGNSNSNYVVYCDYCSKKGHNAERCYNRIADEAAENDTGNASGNVARNEKQNISLVCVQSGLVTESMTVDDNWYLDTGASQHITNNPNKFIKYELFKKPKFVRVGSGKKLQVHGQGNLQVDIHVNGRWNAAMLSNVWYVKGFSNNLFSVQSTLQRNSTWDFRANRRSCSLFEGKPNNAKLYGDFVEASGLYKLRLRVKTPKIVANAFYTKSPCNLQLGQIRNQVKTAPTANQGKMDNSRTWSSVVKSGIKTKYRKFEPEGSKQTPSGDSFNPNFCHYDISFQEGSSEVSSMGESVAAKPAYVNRVANALSAIQVPLDMTRRPSSGPITGSQLQATSSNRRSRSNNYSQYKSVCLLQGRRDRGYYAGGSCENDEMDTGSNQMFDTAKFDYREFDNSCFSKCEKSNNRKGYQHGRVLSFVN